MKLFATSLLLCFFAADHDMRVARFRVEEQGSQYQLRVTLDRVDILAAVYSQPSSQGDVIEQIGDYLKAHVSYRFDGQPVPYDFESIEYTKETIHLTGTFQAADLDLHEIEVVNTCLVDQIKGHLNIMEFFVNDDQRFFRLHEGRTKTIFDYD